MDAWTRALRAINEIAASFVVLVIFLVSIWTLDKILHALWPPDGLILFEKSPFFELPAKWIFDASHLGLLLAFLVLSIIIFIRIYRE